MTPGPSLNQVRPRRRSIDPWESSVKSIVKETYTLWLFRRGTINQIFRRSLSREHLGELSAPSILSLRSPHPFPSVFLRDSFPDVCGMLRRDKRRRPTSEIFRRPRAYLPTERNGGCRLTWQGDLTDDEWGKSSCSSLTRRFGRIASFECLRAYLHFLRRSEQSPVLLTIAQKMTSRFFFVKTSYHDRSIVSRL